MIDFLRHAYGQFSENKPMGPAKWRHFDLLFIHEGEVSVLLNGSEQVGLGAKQGMLIYPETSFEGFSVPEGD